MPADYIFTNNFNALQINLTNLTKNFANKVREEVAIRVGVVHNITKLTTTDTVIV